MPDICLYPIFVRQGTNKQKATVGYIDRSGTLVIEPAYDDGTYFYDGMAAIQAKNKWGFIDSTGRVRISPRFPNPGYFESGVASVSTGSGHNYGVIDVSGSLIVASKRQEIGRFSEAMAWFSPGTAEEHESYGFMNKDGQIVVGPSFSRAASFSEGLAAVELNRRWGFVQRSGAFHLQPTYLGVYDEQGKEVLAGVSSFRQGLARIRIGSHFGYINRNGQVQFHIAADWALPFAGDRALIRMGENYGFIDTSGNLVIDARFSLANDFCDGMSSVEVTAGRKRLWGVLDPNGNWLVEPKFLYALAPRKGLCFFETDKTIGYVNAAGESVWEGPFVQYRAFGL